MFKVLNGIKDNVVKLPLLNTLFCILITLGYPWMQAIATCHVDPTDYVATEPKLTLILIMSTPYQILTPLP